MVRRRWRTTVGLAAAGLVVAGGLAGCGADGGSDNSTGAAADSRAGAPAAEPGLDAGKPGLDADKPEAAAQEPGAGSVKVEVDARSIIYTGSITVRVANPDETAARAVAVATGAGGFVGSDRRTSDDDRSQATLELRVPAERFTGVVDELARLGEEESRSINTEDVTEQVVDLDARIATQQASVNRTRTLLAQASTIGEIVSVESELAKREGELASLQAKKRRLADLTSLSTITLVLLGPEAAVEEDEPETGFVAGIKGGWKAFLASMEILLTVIGALVPWLIALGVPIYALVWLLRRAGRRRPRPAPVGPGMAAAGAHLPVAAPVRPTMPAPAPRGPAAPATPAQQAPATPAAQGPAAQAAPQREPAAQAAPEPAPQREPVAEPAAGKPAERPSAPPAPGSAAQ